MSLGSVRADHSAANVGALRRFGYVVSLPGVAGLPGASRSAGGSVRSILVTPGMTVSVPRRLGWNAGRRRLRRMRSITPDLIRTIRVADLGAVTKLASLECDPFAAFVDGELK